MVRKCKQLLALQTLINIIYLEYGDWISICNIQRIDYIGSLNIDRHPGGNTFNVITENKDYRISLLGEISEIIWTWDLYNFFEE